MPKSTSAPKRERKRIRRLAKRWSVGAPGSLPITIDGLEKHGRMAVIAMSGAKSDFYNPMEAVLRMLEDAQDPNKQPGPARTLDPSTVKSTAIVNAPRADYAHYRIHVTRMRKIAGYCSIHWQAGPILHGRFYLFRDKVLYQAFDRSKGWINQRVPEGGMDWKALEDGLLTERPTP